MTTKIEHSATQLAAAANVKNIWSGIVVNVKTYGAKGDGVTDDTVAIQAAITYAISIGKDEIVFPAGSYVYTVLTNTTGMTFIGDGVTLSGTTPITLVSLSSQLADVMQRGINVMSAPYNAVGDGVTDNTVVVQQALNDAVTLNIKEVFVPSKCIYALGSLSVPLSVIIFNEQSIIDYNATNTDSTLYIRRTAYFTGGTPGYVNAAIYTFSEVLDNVTSYEWGITSVIDVYANAGEHVALYGKTTKIRGTGAVWGGVIEVIDTSGADTLGTSFIGLEINMRMNASNANLNRIGIDLISRTYGVGARGEISQGIRLNGDGRFKTGIDLISDMDTGFKVGGTMTNGISFTGRQNQGIAMGGTKAIGINLSGAVFDNNGAIRLGANQYIELEATGSMKMKYNATSGFIEFYNGGVRKGYIDMSGVDHAL